MKSLSRRQATTVLYLSAFLLYLLAAGIWYHAILLHPNSRVPCCVSDGTSTLRDYMIAGAEHRNILTFSHDAFNGAPEGTQRAVAAQLANAGLQTLFVGVFRGPIGLVSAWNLYALLGLVGTAIAVFWLLRRLGCTPIASLFGGYVVGFCPDAIGRVGAGHLAFIQNWIFVLVVFAAQRVRERRTYASATVLGAVGGIAFYISAYQGLFATVIAIVFLSVDVKRLRPRPDRIRSLALLSYTLIINTLTLIPLGIAYQRNRAAVQNAASHGGADLLYFGARLGAYLVPSPNNPLFHWARGIHPADAVEQTLFVGFITIALAVCGYVLLFRRNSWLRESEQRWWTAVSIAVLVPVTVILSLPPAYHVGSSLVPTPSIVLAGFTAYWRVYSRFGMVAGFGLAVLAALALSAIAARRPRLGRILGPLALAVVVLELMPGNIASFSTTAQPGWVKWLGSAPHGIVASYPLDSQGVANDQYWYQALDGDPGFVIANGNLGAIQSRAQAIRWLALDLGAPLTARVLSTERVRYVVIDGDAYRAERRRRPHLDKHHYTLLARVGGFTIYSVHAQPVELDHALRAHEGEIARLEGVKFPKLVLQSGFGPVERGPTLNGRPLGDRGVIAVDNPGEATLVRLTGQTVNHGPPLVLRVIDGHGKTVATQIVPTGSGQLRSTALKVAPESHFSLAVVRSHRAEGLYLSKLKLIPLPLYVTARTAAP